MTHVTCRLTAKIWDQLRNSTLLRLYLTPRAEGAALISVSVALSQTPPYTACETTDTELYIAHRVACLQCLLPSFRRYKQLPYLQTLWKSGEICRQTTEMQSAILNGFFSMLAVHV